MSLKPLSTATATINDDPPLAPTAHPLHQAPRHSLIKELSCEFLVTLLFTFTTAGAGVSDGYVQPGV